MRVTVVPLRPDPPAPDQLHAQWSQAMREVLDEPRRIRVHYQPIVDLARGVVCGYEALARFPQAPDIAPRAWFEAAARLGCTGALEAQVVQAALVARPLLVRNRFISVNVSPAALLSQEVQSALHCEPHLDRIVVELVDGDPAADAIALRTAIDALRAGGARISIDDAGPDSFDRVVALQPQFIKVEAPPENELYGLQAEVVRALGELATLNDAWVIAKGVESIPQLEALNRLSVPFAQGFALGRPSPAMSELPRDVREHVGASSGAPVDSLRTLALDMPIVQERAPAVPGAEGQVLTLGPQTLGAAFAAGSQITHVLCLDAERRPVAIAERGGFSRGEQPHSPLCLAAGTSASEAARRAMARAPDLRYDPVICVDDAGVYAGAVPVDRIVACLAR